MKKLYFKKCVIEEGKTGLEMFLFWAYQLKSDHCYCRAVMKGKGDETIFEEAGEEGKKKGYRCAGRTKEAYLAQMLRHFEVDEIEDVK